jgi:hypothetical protein
MKLWQTESEIKFLQEQLKKSGENSIVFSHNDLLANNVLIVGEKD